MSHQLLVVLSLALLAGLLTWLSWNELKIGSVRNPFWHGSHIERDYQPAYFWISWTLWAALACASLAITASKGWQAFQAPDPTPASARDLALWGILIALAAVFGAWLALPVRWFRRGNRWTHRAEYRREKALRAQLKQLTDDRKVGEGDDEDTLDFLVDWSKIEWLEQLAANLAAQSPPRRLQLALDQTPEPTDEDVDDEP